MKRFDTTNHGMGPNAEELGAGVYLQHQEAETVTEGMGLSVSP